MRIECLSLERYGGFSNRKLIFRPDAALHVVLGANESGKTTALSAIGDLLFGFGHLTPYDFAHDGKTLRIGGEFRLAGGTALVIRRRKGNKNTLVDANDQPLPDDLLAPLIGSVSRDMFRREFGLTAEELRAGGHELLKAGGRLAETLAASSAGLTALSHLRETLSLEADALFTPRKSSGKTFYIAAERHEAAERRLRDAIVTADALRAADAAVEEATRNLASLTAGHQQAGRDLARFQRSVRTRPKLARLNNLAHEITAFGGLPMLPAATVASWRTAWLADTEIAGQLGKLDAGDAADAASIAALAVDEDVLSSGAAIDALRERLGAVRKAIEDMPRRREARRSAQDALNEAAQRLGLASHKTLFERLPADPALAHVRELVEAGKRAAERRSDAEARRDKAHQERHRLESQAGNATHAADPETFRQRLEALADVPTDADRLRREIAACDAEERSLAEIAAALDPAVGDLDGLAGLPLPDEAAIATHARIADRSTEEERNAQAELTAAERAIETCHAELSRLTRDGASVTKADLQVARADRDASFDRLRSALDGDAAHASECLAAAQSLSRAVDHVADRLLTDAERAARRQTAEERIIEARRQRERAAAAHAAVETRRMNSAAAWRELWTASDITPRFPAEMLRWRERVTSILNRRSGLVSRRAETHALAARLNDCRAALAKLLEDHGRTAGAALPADLLHREAKILLNGLQSAWTNAREHAVARKGVERDIAEAEAALARSDEGLAARTAAWPAAMQSIGLAPAASFAEAESAMAIWQGVAVPKSSFEREGRSVEGMEIDIAAFDVDVAAVVRQAAPDLTGGSAQESLERLTPRLGEARRAADSRARLRQSIEERKSVHAALRSQRDAVTATLVEACNKLNLEDPAELGPELDRLEQRQSLAAERSALARELVDIADGFDEDGLRAEQAGLDPDVLPGEIERLGLRLGSLLAEIGEASVKRHQAERDRDTLAQGRDAGGAARERAEASAELLSITERWIVRAAAVRLASRAIERHRAAVQDPLIARAGALFRVATAAAFDGLGADYDDADRPVLVAVRANRTRVPVAGLSEGTRDQLFLALRLALLERRTAEPLPFIADDLLASFDEPRSGHTLELLANFGGNRQVILFTHHRHVAELAKAMPDRMIDIISL